MLTLHALENLDNSKKKELNFLILTLNILCGSYKVISDILLFFSKTVLHF